MPASLSIELDSGSKSYGYIHVAGCRDLKDPEPLGAIHSLVDVGVIVAECTGWECEDKYPLIAPCAKNAFK